MKKIGILFLSAIALLSSCKKDNDGHSGIFKGPEVQVHNGKAWTWIQIDNSGKPERLGVTINDAALCTLHKKVNEKPITAAMGFVLVKQKLLFPLFVIEFHPNTRPTDID